MPLPEPIPFIQAIAGVQVMTWHHLMNISLSEVTKMLLGQLLPRVKGGPMIEFHHENVCGCSHMSYESMGKVIEARS